MGICTVQGPKQMGFNARDKHRFLQHHAGDLITSLKGIITEIEYWNGYFDHRFSAKNESGAWQEKDWGIHIVAWCVIQQLSLPHDQASS